MEFRSCFFVTVLFKFFNCVRFSSVVFSQRIKPCFFFFLLFYLSSWTFCYCQCHVENKFFSDCMLSFWAEGKNCYIFFISVSYLVILLLIFFFQIAVTAVVSFFFLFFFCLKVVFFFFWLLFLKKREKVENEKLKYVFWMKRVFFKVHCRVFWYHRFTTPYFSICFPLELLLTFYYTLVFFISRNWKAFWKKKKRESRL